MDTMRAEFIKWQIQQSMGEELTAGSTYMQRAQIADEAGDNLTADLYREIAKDELYDHYALFNERLYDLMAETGGQASSPFWLHQPKSVPRKVNVPAFKIGDKVTHRYLGNKQVGEIVNVGEFHKYYGYVYDVKFPDGSTEQASERSLQLAQTCNC